jgi:hypothetical protein
MLLVHMRHAVKEAALSSLASAFILVETTLHLDQTEAQLILFLLENNWVREEELRQALHKGIIACGLNSFEESKRKFPDHTRSPAALGYALLHGTIAEKQARKIRFDHGETVEKYKENAGNLLEIVYTQIATIATRPTSTLPHDSSDDCFCCH